MAIILQDTVSRSRRPRTWPSSHLAGKWQSQLWKWPLMSALYFTVILFMPQLEMSCCPIFIIFRRKKKAFQNVQARWTSSRGSDCGWCKTRSLMNRRPEIQCWMRGLCLLLSMHFFPFLVSSSLPQIHEGEHFLLLTGISRTKIISI